MARFAGGRNSTPKRSQSRRPWAAVSEVLIALIGRFDATDPGLPTQRIHLWLKEPALRARYMQYVNHAEQVIADRLHRHRGTKPEHDDLPQLIAVAATGAYRVALFTHTGAKSGRRLTKHLHEALDILAGALADQPEPRPSKRVRRSARAS